MLRVIRSEEYLKDLGKLDNKERMIVLNFEQKIAELPYIGKPLGLPFLREKKFDGKRILFLIYQEHSLIYLINISDKKTQKEDIHFILANLEKYKSDMRKFTGF